VKWSAPYESMGRAVAFAPDSSRLAVVQVPGILGFPKKFAIHILEVPSGKARNEIATDTTVNDLAFSPDGKFLVAGSDDPTIRLWCLDPERQEREFRGHQGAVNQVGFSTDGRRLFSASGADGTLRTWNNDNDDKDAGKEIKRVVLGHDLGPMMCAAFWPGSRGLTGHKDGNVVLWDMTSGEELKRLKLRDAAVTAVAISPDGQHGLAALADRCVYLFRLSPTGDQR
jgi:WD40 repeat protein